MGVHLVEPLEPLAHQAATVGRVNAEATAAAVAPAKESRVNAPVVSFSLMFPGLASLTNSNT